MYISYDHGNNWRSFQLNLPVVPITDLALKNNDLVVATQGRAFWVLDDLSVVQQMNEDVLNKKLFVFNNAEAWRISGSGGRGGGGAGAGTNRNAGANPPNGAIINFYALNISDSTKATVTIYDKNNKLIRSYSTEAKEAADKMELNAGMNQFVWNLQYPSAERIEGMVLWNGVPAGIVAPPGNYSYVVKVGSDSAMGRFVVKADPNYKIPQSDYDEQFAMLSSIRDKFNEVQEAIKDIRTLRTQMNDFVARQDKDAVKEIKPVVDTINKQLTGIEEKLYQTKAKSSQDVLNYPIRLNDKLSGLFNAANSGNVAPSKQVREVFAELKRQTDEQLLRFKKIKEQDIPALNKLIREKSVPVIGLKKD